MCRLWFVTPDPALATKVVEIVTRLIMLARYSKCSNCVQRFYGNQVQAEKIYSAECL